MSRCTSIAYLFGLEIVEVCALQYKPPPLPAFVAAALLCKETFFVSWNKALTGDLRS